MSKILCPVDQTEMHEVGDHGIVDYDGNWDAQATKYECSAEKKHTIFVVDSEDIFDPYDEVFESVDSALETALEKAVWVPAHFSSFIQLSEHYSDRILSLEGLRNELAKIAVQAFKDAAEAIGILAEERIEYEYIHAMEDVDEVLAEEKFHAKLKEMGWVDQPKDYPKKQ